MVNCEYSSPVACHSHALDMTIDDLRKAEVETSVNWEKPTVKAPTQITYIEHENPFSTVDNASGAPHTSQLSSNAWVGCGGDIYVLECLGRGFIRIEPTSEASLDEQDEGKKKTGIDNAAAYAAHFIPAAPDRATSRRLKLAPFRKSRRVLTATTLADAIRGCDTYATTRVIIGPQVTG
jgi:ATP-dependent helicase IRC3